MTKTMAKTVFVTRDEDGTEGTTHYDTDLEALGAAYDRKFRAFFSDLRDLNDEASTLIQRDCRLPMRCAEWLALVNDVVEADLLNRAQNLLFAGGGTLQHRSWGTLFQAMQFIQKNKAEFAKLVEEFRKDRAIRGVPIRGDGSVQPASPPEHTRALDMGEDNDGRNEDDGEIEAHGHPD